MAMWRILLLQIQRQLRRHIHIIDWFIYVLPILAIGIPSAFFISINKYREDKHEEISIFTVNRTRYLMITDSEDTNSVKLQTTSNSN